MSCATETCPITLEAIDPLYVYRHSGIVFDVFAIYTHLTTSVHFVNPVTRAQFTLQDLEDLERQVQQLCGEDAIYVPDETSGSDIFDPGTDDDHTEVDEVPMELEVLPLTIDERIRLQVNLNIAPSNTPTTSEGDPEEDLAYFDVCNLDVDLDHVDDGLPPKRCFPSIVAMYNDTARAKKLKSDLDLIQYLTYDSLDIFSQMVSLLSDDHFQQMVWEQTSHTVFSVINQIVGEQNGGSTDVDVDVDVEVTYSDCWETYRSRMLRVLNRRYVEVIQDMRRIDPAEAELCVKSHKSDVENNTTIPSERKLWLVSALTDLLH